MGKPWAMLPPSKLIQYLKCEAMGEGANLIIMKQLKARSNQKAALTTLEPSLRSVLSNSTCDNL
jgi:hypothetical protein